MENHDALSKLRQEKPDRLAEAGHKLKALVLRILKMDTIISDTEAQAALGRVTERSLDEKVLVTEVDVSNAEKARRKLQALHARRLPELDLEKLEAENVYRRLFRLPIRMPIGDSDQGKILLAPQPLKK